MPTALATLEAEALKLPPEERVPCQRVRYCSTDTAVKLTNVFGVIGAHPFRAGVP